MLFGSQFCPENVQSAAPLELGMQLGQHNSQDVSFAPSISPAQAHSHHPKLAVNTEIGTNVCQTQLPSDTVRIYIYSN